MRNNFSRLSQDYGVNSAPRLGFCGFPKDAVRHFLEMIHEDFGQQALRTALSSVKQHTEWYKGLRPSGLPAIESIYREFLKRIS